jgi:hypothetical protein
MLCRYTDSGVCAAKTPEACVCGQDPNFLIFGLADVPPEALHNIIADAVGEPREYPNRRRNLRKDNGIPPKTPGGNSDDGPSSPSK